MGRKAKQRVKKAIKKARGTANERKMAEVPLGMPADDVLKLWGPGLRSKKLGEDEQGHIVEWEYVWGFLVFRRRKRGKIRCYRVVEKRVKGDG